MDDGLTARLEHPEELSEEHLLVGDALGGMLGPDDVEALVVKGDVGHVGLVQRDLVAQARDLVEKVSGFQVGPGHVDPGDLAVVGPGQIAGRASHAAARVENSIALLHPRTLGEPLSRQQPHHVRHWSSDASSSTEVFDESLCAFLSTSATRCRRSAGAKCSDIFWTILSVTVGSSQSENRYVKCGLYYRGTPRNFVPVSVTPPALLRPDTGQVTRTT